jgi:hypothetical protein
MIQTHHDGHGLNESIVVQTTDEVGPGGAHHSYTLFKRNGSNREQELGYLQFQKGPVDEPGSTSGITEAALLAVLIDRLEAFQAGPYACEENQQALDNLRAAMTAVHARAHARAERGVLGTYKL